MMRPRRRLRRVRRRLSSAMVPPEPASNPPRSTPNSSQGKSDLGTLAHRAFPGYAVAGVATLAYLASAPGQTFIISLLKPSLVGMIEGERAELINNTAYTIATAAAALPLVYVGRLADRFGPRAVLAALGVLFGLACASVALVQGMVTIFVAYFLLRFLGQGAMVLVGQHAVAMWFHRKLGRVSGAKNTAVFLAWAALPTLVGFMIAELGWRWTYVVFGVAVAALVTPAALLFVRNRPEEVGLLMDNDAPSAAHDAASDRKAPVVEASFTLGEAVRTRAYWFFAAAFFLMPLIGTGMLLEGQGHLTGRGLTPTQAGFALGGWSLAMGLMAIPSGVLADRFLPRGLMTIGMLVIGGSSAVLATAQGVWMGYASFVLLGLGQSLVMTTGVTAVARFYGRAHHGAIRSSLTRIGVIGTSLGPLATGISVTLAEGYTPAFWAFAVATLPVALVCVWLVRPEAAHDNAAP